MKRKNRHPLWRLISNILRIFVRKPKFIFLGEEFSDQSLYLSNHVGAKVPLALELYFPKEFRFWGVHSMNDSFKARYKYLAVTYFHEKKHLNKILSYLIAVVATPVLGVFYWGIRLLPTYNDSRLIPTIRKSINIFKENQSIVIFPEDSSNGYHDLLTHYYSGFYLLAKKAYEKGIDLKIYNMYFQKKTRSFIVDEPIKYSELLTINKTGEEIAEMFKNRANELAQMKEF